MKTKYLVMMLGGLLIFILLFSIEGSDERRVDWEESYSRDEKSPFGNFIFHDQLKTLFPAREITTMNLSITEELEPNYKNYYTTQKHIDENGDEVEEEIRQRKYKSSFIPSNYILINRELNLDNVAVKYLMDFTSNGGNVFLSSRFFSQPLLDSLHFHLTDLKTFTEEKQKLFFANPDLKNDTGFTFTNFYYYPVFDSLDSHAQVLAYDKDKNPIYVRIEHGKGAFYINTIPTLFTNYAALNSTEAMFRSISFLPVLPVLWDEYYKMGRRESQSLFRFFLDNKALRMAYYLAIIGLVLYVLFEGKRRQRIIPISDKLNNSSVEFAETVGRLYFQKGDHYDLAMKNIGYFFDYMRSTYNIDPARELFENREVFYKKVQEKTGKSMRVIRDVFGYIIILKSTTSIVGEQLADLNSKIELFKEL